jgi:hypothetical protein
LIWIWCFTLAFHYVALLLGVEISLHAPPLLLNFFCRLFLVADSKKQQRCCESRNSSLTIKSEFPPLFLASQTRLTKRLRLLPPPRNQITGKINKTLGNLPEGKLSGEHNPDNEGYAFIRALRGGWCAGLAICGKSAYLDIYMGK